MGITFDADVGSATPSGGAITFAGTSLQGITSSASGSTVTYTIANASAVQKGVSSFNATEFTVTAGVVTSNAITMSSGNNITVSGSPVNLGGSVSIAVTGTTQYSLQVGNASGSLSSLGVATNGQIPIGSTGANPVLASLISSDSTVTITNGAGSINLQVPAGGGLSLAPFGSTPNTEGLSLTAGVLNMQPADATHPGGLSIIAQTFTGVKTFSSAPIFSSLTGVLTANGSSALVATAITQYNVITGGVSDVPNSVAPSATAGIPLISQGASSQPIFGTAVVAGGGTGAVSFTSYMPVCGGTSTTGALQSVSTSGAIAGYLLTYVSSSALPTWQAPSSAVVNSLAGTANQVLVNATSGSPQTGILTVAFPATAGISIGSYQATTAPVGGIIAPGIVGIGLSSPSSLAQLEVVSGNAYNTYLTGTQVLIDGANSQWTNLWLPTFAYTNDWTSSSTVYNQPTFVAASGKTLTNAFGYYSALVMNANVGTITNSYGIFLDTGSSATGTVTNSYNLYVSNPAFGTNKVALYADNIAVGTTATAPPSNGILVLGNIKNTALTASNLVATDASKNLVSVAIPLPIAYGGTNATSMATTNGVNYYDGTRIVTTAVGTATHVLTSNGVGVAPTFQAIPVTGVTSITGTANQIVASASTGAVTLSFPATAGISIGSYQATTAPVGGIIAPGIVGIGLSAPSSLAQLEVVSSNAYNVYLTGTQTAVDGANTQWTNLLLPTFSPTNGATSVSTFYNQPTFIALTGKTINNAWGYYSNMVLNSNVGTIDLAAGIFVDVGTSSSGTVTAGFGLYVKKPLFGTSKISTYTDDLAVGAAVVPPANGLFVSGDTTMGGNLEFFTGTKTTYPVGSYDIPLARMVIGAVNMNTGVKSGDTTLNSGFLITGSSPGNLVISWQSTFAAAPFIVGTCNWQNTIGVLCKVTSSSTSAAAFQTINTGTGLAVGNDGLVDIILYFMAYGR